MEPLLVFGIIFTLRFSYVAQLEQSETFINLVNENQSIWTSGRNTRNLPDDDPSIDYLANLIGNLDTYSEFDKLPLLTHTLFARGGIPDSFDARIRWPFCKDVMNVIRNQGKCSGCWAFGAVTVMADRLCIETNGSVKIQFSPDDVLTCCKRCGEGCLGGSTIKVWEYWIQNRIVSGGDYDSHNGCKPYSETSFKNLSLAKKCERTCTNSNYPTSYRKDLRRGVLKYRISNKVKQIQMEIMARGPVEVTFKVYEDFFKYKNGVFQHVTGRKIRNRGTHCVKILGWGTENSIPYWLVANSWGTKWAYLGGFFKFLRGENHCGIENFVIAGRAIESRLSPREFLSFDNKTAPSNFTTARAETKYIPSGRFTISVFLVITFVFIL